MKNLFRYFAIFSVIILSMTSCSSDDNSRTSVVLLKKLTNVSFGTNGEYNFTYNGTKLNKVTFTLDNQTDGNGYDKYFYTGDLITEIKRYNASNHNIIRTLFTYNLSNQLTQVVRLELDANYGRKTVYQYNPDGSIESSIYSGNLESQNTASSLTEKVYFQNGEIVAKEYTIGTSQSSIGFSYDSANHPLKNVTGLGAIKIYDFMADGLFGVEHNLLQRAVYDANGDLDHSISFEGVYNQDNYPTNIYGVDTPEGIGYNFEYYK